MSNKKEEHLFMLKGKEIILGVTGGIAAYKAAEIIRRLKDKGAGVTVIMTVNASRFITSLTLETLSQNTVYCSLFREGQEWEPTHVSLADKADLLLVAPATANVIGKLAVGIADDLLTTTVMTVKCPVMLIVGKKDPFVYPEKYKMFKKVLPNCREVFLEEGGPFVPDELPDAFSELVMSFVENS